MIYYRSRKILVTSLEKSRKTLARVMGCSDKVGVSHEVGFRKFSIAVLKYGVENSKSFVADLLLNIDVDLKNLFRIITMTHLDTCLYVEFKTRKYTVE